MSKGNISVSIVTKIPWQNIVDYGALVNELVINNTLLLLFLNKGENIALGDHPLKRTFYSLTLLAYYVAYLLKWVS